jgi:hypothetical protein
MIAIPHAKFHVFSPNGNRKDWVRLTELMHLSSTNAEKKRENQAYYIYLCPRVTTIRSEDSLAPPKRANNLQSLTPMPGLLEEPAEG